MPTKELFLDENRRLQLEKNVNDMLSNGIDEDGIASFVSEYKTKFGQPLKKKDVSFGSELPYAKTSFNAPSPSIENISPSKLASPSPKELVAKIKDFANKPNTRQEVSPEEESYISRLGDRAVRGMNTLNANLAKTPEFIYNLAALPQNAISDVFDIPILEVSAEKVKKDLGINNEVAQYYDNEIKKLAYLDAKYSASQGSITELVKKGNYKDAAKLLGEQIVESLPTTALIASTGGLGASPTAITLGGGAVFGAAKYDEIKDREDLTEAEKTSISFSTGLVEGLFENIGTANLGRAAKEIFLKEGAETAAKQLKQTFVETYKEALKKYMPISGALSEGLEEAGTQFAQNAIDIYGGVEPDKKITDGVIDAFIVGTGSGAIISAPTLLTKKRTQEVAKVEQEVQALDNDIANENVPEEVKAELVKSRQQKMEMINAIVEEDTNEQKSLPEETKREIEQLYGQKEQLTQGLETDISEESKKILSDKIVEIDNKIETISTPTLETQTTEPINEAQKTENIQVEPTSTEDISLPNGETAQGTDTQKAEVVGVEPTAEQQFNDIKNGNVITFEYKNESEVPEVFKDKISSKGEINGKSYVKVTVAKSLADYTLQTPKGETKEPIVSENAASENKETPKSELPFDFFETPIQNDVQVEITVKDKDGADKTLKVKASNAQAILSKRYDNLNKLIKCLG